MKKVKSLNEVISFDSSFKTSVNLYLSLNKSEKVLNYIPTKSSVAVLNSFVSAVLNNKEQSTLLVGPYGKGKSHLLLVLLAILSMDRTAENKKVIDALIKKVKNVDDAGCECADNIETLWNRKKLLPVLISYSSSDLNQSFLQGLNDALKREKLVDLIPDTYYSIAIERLVDWEVNYKDTYSIFEKELKQYGKSIPNLMAELKMYSRDALELFQMLYPKVTAGSMFNPLAVSDVLPLYRSVSEKIVEDYGYGGIYIVFDEFSKFIESQDGQATGSNMKLLQDMCELSTNSQFAQVFITMVAHKSIKEYGKYLSADIINSFTGIEGRLIEKYFVTSSKNNYELIRNAIIKKTGIFEECSEIENCVNEQMLKAYYQLPVFRSSFSKTDFESIILKGCYPLNPISAYLLLNISEKVAQNERTLFTFISNDEPYSMARFVLEHTHDQAWSIDASLIYDYFKSLFKKEVSNEYIHNVWLSAEYAIGKCKSDDQIRLIKSLAIILIVNKEDEIPADNNYLSLCTNIEDYSQAISDLISAQILYKKSSTGAYAFKTRAGSELKSEIKRRRAIKGDNVNYSKMLVDVTGRYYVIPRRYNTLHCMTRFFTNEFMHVDEFLDLDSADAILSDLSSDGKVITLYSFCDVNQEKVRKHLKKLGDSRIIVVCPIKSLKIQKQLRDYEIIQEIKSNQVFINNNEILKNELPLLIDDLTTEIELALRSIYEDDQESGVFFFKGKRVARVNNVEEAVNECCKEVYYKTPVINNEIVNRRIISTAQTRKARTNIIQAILAGECDESFYAGSNQEATVYRSLFKCTKLLEGAESEELAEIIRIINSFIDGCCDKKEPVSNLVRTLTNAPYGMRLGVVPMFLAHVFASRREDIIVYFADHEVQLNADIVVDMCENSGDYALFVSKEDLQKEKYISELNVLFGVSDNRNLTSNRIKDIVICMQRWFRGLAQSSRNLVSVEKYINDEVVIRAMKTLKKTLQTVDFNPYEILFVTLPNEFKCDSLESTFEMIDECKTYFDDYYDWLLLQTAGSIRDVWGGKKKKTLQQILYEWYETQSIRSKQGLHSGRITNFMSCISSLNVFSDSDVAMKVVKAVTNTYIENWNTESFDDFIADITSLKLDVEHIRDEESNGELELIFQDRNGDKITKLYNYAQEGSGSVLRNIIEDALEEYEDLSVNDRVSILLEMIEKIIK